jgi:hypothetical protein
VCVWICRHYDDAIKDFLAVMQKGIPEPYTFTDLMMHIAWCYELKGQDFRDGYATAEARGAFGTAFRALPGTEAAVSRDCVLGVPSQPPPPPCSSPLLLPSCSLWRRLCARTDCALCSFVCCCASWAMNDRARCAVQKSEALRMFGKDLNDDPRWKVWRDTPMTWLLLGKRHADVGHIVLSADCFSEVCKLTMRCDAMRCDAMRCDAMRCDAM